jgi:hypothetical protein
MKMNKKIIFMYFIIPFFSIVMTFQISNAEPLQVNVIDSYYHLWGNMHVDNAGDLNDIYYNESSDTPISKEVYMEYYWPSGYYYLGKIKSSTYDFGLRLNAFSYGYANARAETEWTFKPINNVDQLKIRIQQEAIAPWYSWGVFLEDVTMSLSLSNYCGGGNGGSSSYKYFEGSIVSSLNYGGEIAIYNEFTPDHLYRLYFWGSSTSVWDNPVFSIQAVYMYATPEPTTMLLLGLGLMGLVGIRRKFKK